ncbi:hypothetical protein Trydic_g17692 [Trypoxylus dichotomus]
MVHEVERLKMYVAIVNVLIIILGICSFIVGCVFIVQFTEEVYRIKEDESPSLIEVFENDTSLDFCWTVGRALIAFGAGIIALSIVTIVGVFKHNSVLLKLVTAALVICVIVFALIGIGFLIVNNSLFVDEGPKVAPPLDEKQQDYIMNKYNCCYHLTSTCLITEKIHCDIAIVHNNRKFRDVLSSFFTIGAILDIIAIVLTAFLIKAFNELRKPKFLQNHLLST